MELRKEFQLQEVALQRSLAKLRCDLQRAQEEARENRERSYKLQGSLAAAENNNKVKGKLRSEPSFKAFLSCVCFPEAWRFENNDETNLFMSRSIIVYSSWFP